MTRYRSLARANRGFTLLEVLVAFSILALSLGVLLGLFSIGLRNAAISHEYSWAVSMAESKLAEIGVSEPIRPGESKGGFDGKYRWRTEIATYAGDNEAHLTDVKWQLYRVTVQIIWESLDGERSVILKTLRLISITE